MRTLVKRQAWSSGHARASSPRAPRRFFSSLVALAAIASPIGAFADDAPPTAPAAEAAAPRAAEPTAEPAGTPTPEARAVTPVAAAPVEAAGDPCATEPKPKLRGPAPALKLAGEATQYVPLASLSIGKRCMQLSLPIALAERYESVSSFPVDRYGTTFGGKSTSPEVRVGGRFSSGLAWAPVALLFEAEADLVTGVAAPDPGISGQGYPGTEGTEAQLRKLHARFSLARFVHLDVGAQTSHVGMGLVANDGAHGWEPGSTSFVDPRSGDRVLRAALSTGPHGPLAIAASIGADKVLGDDVLLSGDSARQFFGAVVVGMGKPSSAGVYVVRRHQENADGRATDVTVVDVNGKASYELSDVTLGLETEWALVAGSTDLGASADHVKHDVLELGGAARASIDAGMLGGVLDFLYASGDRNPYDSKQNAFHVDPNYGFGLLLFRQVVAAQTARTVATAADPSLAGLPPQDLERVPSRGSPTNTVAFFPKARVRPVAGLEFYGGPLFAFANVENTDPFNTQITGGAPRSALGGEGGTYLGTELDLGVRFRALVHGAELTLGAEGGMLSPGSAFRTLDGGTMATVKGGRGMARLRF